MRLDMHVPSYQGEHPLSKLVRSPAPNNPLPLLLNGPFLISTLAESLPLAGDIEPPSSTPPNGSPCWSHFLATLTSNPSPLNGPSYYFPVLAPKVLPTASSSITGSLTLMVRIGETSAESDPDYSWSQLPVPFVVFTFEPSFLYWPLLIGSLGNVEIF